MSQRQIQTPETAMKLNHLVNITEKIPYYKLELKIGILVEKNCQSALDLLEFSPKKAVVLCTAPQKWMHNT